MVTTYCTVELTTVGFSGLRFDDMSNDERTSGEVIACITLQGSPFNFMKLVHNVSLDL